MLKYGFHTMVKCRPCLKDEICPGFALLAYRLPTNRSVLCAMPSARTPFHAGVERAEMAQGDSVAAGAWQGLTRYVSGPVCAHVCAMTRRRQSRSLTLLRVRLPLCESVSVVAPPFTWGAACYHRLNGRLSA